MSDWIYAYIAIIIVVSCIGILLIEWCCGKAIPTCCHNIYYWWQYNSCCNNAVTDPEMEIEIVPAKVPGLPVEIIEV